MPDSNSQLTSNHGWDTIKNKDFLIEVISEFKKHGIRTSIFVDPIEQFINGAQLTGTDRIELYTESYANTFLTNKEKAILNFVKASQLAQNLNLGVNAGHDLNLENLNYFKNNIPNLLEVSIGHALISDALYLGLENTVQMYLKQLL